MAKARKETPLTGIEKSPTGIQGFDEITGGGLPKGRPTLVCGRAGCGKTLLAMEFLVQGATQFGEPGVFVSFEEPEADLVANMASLGWDLKRLARQKKLMIDYVHIDRREIEETGEYNLDGLFIRLQAAIELVGARRIVLDTMEALFGGFTNDLIMRAELRRLLLWLKKKGLTAVITGEPGETTMTRHGMEEYVSDCVISLDHRIHEQVANRRMRIVKYRGSSHGTNEYPFLIDNKGITIFPLTSIGLDHEVSTRRISSGIARLDTMLGGKGYYRGSSVLISGTAGTGKSSLAAGFAAAACGRNERVLYFSFEEAPKQILRNMGAIGLHLAPWVKKGLLRFRSARATSYGLEMHLSVLHKEVLDFQPAVVVVDPISNLSFACTMEEIKGMLCRMIDFLKGKGITTLFTDLTRGGDALETTVSSISSLMDTWILLRDIEYQGERTRGVYVLKSRGMAHSNQIREFVITDRGIDLIDVYAGPGGVLTGTARLSREAQERAAQVQRRQEAERTQRELERRRTAFEAQVAALQAQYEAEVEELEKSIRESGMREQTLLDERRNMAAARGRDKT